MTRATVMIVDDDELDRYLLTRDLESTGVDMKVFEARDGEEALKFFVDQEENERRYGEDFPPSLIFLDINMPRVSGIEFLGKFDNLRKQSGAYTGCVFLMCSSSEHHEEIQRALEHEFVADFIVKGQIDPEDLGRKILQLV